MFEGRSGRTDAILYANERIGRAVIQQKLVIAALVGGGCGVPSPEGREG